LFDRIRSIFGIEIYFGTDQNNYSNFSNSTDEKLYESILFAFLDSHNILILIDGLDELPPVKYENTILEIQQLTHNLNTSKIFLTCRSGPFESRIENSQVFEICPFDDDQIESFVKNWYRNTTTAEHFLKGLNKSPYKDTSVKPLLLTLLCSLYDKYKSIPPKPKSVYKRIVRMLVEEWDQQREIKRESLYSEFDLDKK